MKRTLLALVAIASLTAPAFAQRAQRSPEELAAAFTKADADKDGKLDFAEWKTTLPEQFAAAGDDRLQAAFKGRDKDGDGKLTKEEFSAPMQRPAQ